ncbi:general stress protein [Pararcticibacter amylolyticus]|uniref:General stress protein n=2 Tax=Pararcticibacter amylolyticus TaxID=2173175 RepID=A0A2U2PAU4_9SPHI|nr:general stress protein [Pararcticibacter amylolyticus]
MLKFTSPKQNRLSESSYYEQIQQTPMTKLTAPTVEGQLEEIEFIKKARELAGKIGEIKIAMLTTTDAAGKLQSRPMYTFKIEDDGIIWMFASKDSQKVSNITANPQVLLNYSQPDTDLYIVVRGTAMISDDPVKIEELWSDRYKAWFPYGKTDPNLCLLKISPDEAEYWDTPDLLVSQIISLVKNTLSGKPYLEGENKKINF